MQSLIFSKLQSQLLAVRLLADPQLLEAAVT